MDNNTLVIEVYKRLSEGERQLDIDIDDDNYSFITAWYKQALIIYKSRSWNSGSVMNKDYEVVALFYDNKLYVDKTSAFWGWNKEPDSWEALNENGIYLFGDFRAEKLKEINSRIDEIAYSIPVSENIPEGIDSEAYEFLWSKTINSGYKTYKPEYRFSSNSDVNLLIGETSIEKLAQAFYDENSEDIQNYRMLYEYSKTKYDLTDCPYVKLYYKLADMKARNIECTFEKDGQRATAVLDRYALIASFKYHGKFTEIRPHFFVDRTIADDAYALLGETFTMELLVKAKYKKEVLFDTENPDYDKPVADWMVNILSQAG